jgi:hypothetical protein
MPDWLKSRWVIVPALLAALTAGWNGYVALNNDGNVEGRLVDGAGRPVAGANVILLDRNFVVHTERQRTTTDAGGRFHFSGNDNHSLQLEAEAKDLGRSERRALRLWFRAQNVRLAEPLRFSGRLP